MPSWWLISGVCVAVWLGFNGAILWFVFFPPAWKTRPPQP